MVQRAERVQVHNGTLTFYDGIDEVLGVYERAWREVAAADILGSWVPVSLFGAPLDFERVLDRDLPLVRFSRHGFSAHDGLNETSGSYELGKRGELRIWGVVTTLVGCLVAPTGTPAVKHCETARNPEALDRTSRLQVSKGELTLHDADGTEIGRYRRAGHPSE